MKITVGVTNGTLRSFLTDQQYQQIENAVGKTEKQILIKNNTSGAVLYVEIGGAAATATGYPLAYGVSISYPIVDSGLELITLISDTPNTDVRLVVAV